MQDLVSVIMPVYRTYGPYLEKSIESILNQTHDSLELITIIDPDLNDKHHKDVIAVINDYQDDKRIRVICNKTRKGFTRSLNRGIVSSKGEFIARMDSDDISVKTRLERELELLKSSKIHIVGTWAKIVDYEEKMVGVATPPTDSKAIRKIVMLHNPIIHGSVMIEKDVFRNIGLYSPHFRANEDYEVWLRAIKAGYLIANIPKFLFHLRENPTSITRGREWLINRLNYLRSKAFAAVQYGFRSLRDIAFCISTITALFTYPRAGPIRSLIANMQNRISQKHLKM
ncbi:MAG: glycosyltransferase [Candidatus Hodarchaeota archaeon]